MTAKEKAKELVDKFRIHCYCYLGSGMLTNTFDEQVQISNAKQCAIIAVDELIESHLLLTTTHESEPSIRCKRYWQEVKQYLIKMNS